MSDELKNIDDIFRSAIEPMQEKPSGEVWAKLDAGLDKVKADTIKKKYDSLKRIVTVLSFALLCSLIYIISRNEKSFFQQTLYTSDRGQLSGQNHPKKHINQKVPIRQSELNKPDVAANDNASNVSKMAKKMPVTSTSSTANYSVPSTMKKDNTLANVVKRNKISSTIRKNIANDIDAGDNSYFVNGKKKSRNIKAKANVTVIQKAEIDSITELQTDIERKNFIAENLKQDIQLPYEVTNRKNNGFQSKAKERTSVKLPISITGFFSPIITTDALKRESHTSHDAFDDIREGEFENFSFNIGALANIPLNKKWSIESGLIYTAKNSNMKPRKVYAVQTHTGDIKYKYECSAGYWYMDPKLGTQPQVGDSMYASESLMKLKYFTIPVAIKYNFFTKKRFSMFATAGFALNLMQKGKISSEVEDGGQYGEYYTSEKIYGLKKTFISSVLSIGTTYKINKRLYVNFSPTFNLALSPVTQNTSVKTFINTINFSTGLKFNMK